MTLKPPDDPTEDAVTFSSNAANMAVIQEQPLNVQLPQFSRLATGNDWTASFLAAQAHLPASGGEIYVPYLSGGYTITQTITIGKGQRWKGANGLRNANSVTQPFGTTQINFTNNGKGFYADEATTSAWGLEDVLLYGDAALTSQDLLTLGNGVGLGAGIVRNVTTVNAGRDGISMNFCLNTLLEEVRAISNGRHGWKITSQSNANTFARCYSGLNAQWGILYEGGKDNALNMVVESNSRSTTTKSVTCASATDLFTATTHGLAEGDAIRFSTLTGGAGIVAAQAYYVIASGLTANDFRVSTVPGGVTIDVTTDLTVGTLSYVYGGIWFHANTWAATATLSGCHFENNAGTASTTPSVPIRADWISTAHVGGPTVITENGGEYSETNPLLLTGGRFTSNGLRGVIQPVHAVIESTHEGAIFMNPRRWGTGASATGAASFGLTDNSSKSIVVGDGISEGKPGIKIGGDTVFYRNAAGQWRLGDGQRISVEASATTTVFDVRRPAEVSARIAINQDGAITLGPGTSSGDTVLDRSAAGNGIRLANGDHLILGSSTTTGSYIAGFEQTSDPSAPAADGWRLYAKDNGSGKTQVGVLFNTGAFVPFVTQA